MVKKRILVSGGTGGIGSAIVDRLLTEGHTVTIWDTKERPPALPNEIDYEQINFLFPDSARTLARKHVNAFDLFINCAGVLNGPRTLENLSQNFPFRDVTMTINFTTPAAIMEVLGQELVAIIAITSETAFLGSLDPYYAASKAAMNGFIASLGRFGIPAYALAPGIIEGTEMFGRISEGAKQFFQERRGDRPFDKPADVAEVVTRIMDFMYEHDAPRRGTCFDMGLGLCDPLAHQFFRLP